MSRADIEEMLAGTIDESLLIRLLDDYVDAQVKFRSFKLLEGLVASGRFSEVVFSILHWRATGRVELGIDDIALYKEIQNCQGLNESERTHIYRAARDIYALRNRKRGAHESGIDPTSLDARYISNTMNWILAEFIRIYYADDENKAKAIVDSLVKRELPFLEEIDGYPVILDSNITCTWHVLVLLYWKDPIPLAVKEICDLIAPYSTRSQVYGSLRALVDWRWVFRNPETGMYKITQAGSAEVEKNLSSPGI